MTNPPPDDPMAVPSVADSVTRPRTPPELQEGSSPLSSGDEDLLYGDQDDAQSFIQPAISSIATRLSAPSATAAEKARAMDDCVASYEPFQASKPSRAGDRDGHLAAAAPFDPLGTFPSPWQAGPKEFVLRETADPRLPGVAAGFSSPRTGRSSTVGTDALKKLSKALPSISIPSSLLLNLSTPHFFTSSPKADSPNPASSPSMIHPTPARLTPLLNTAPLPGMTRLITKAPPPRPGLNRPPSVASRRSLALRRSTSDDSLLYHSLSRASSFGDDARFDKIRDQVNSRFKALKDSFPDVPTFKMPQLPSE